MVETAEVRAGRAGPFKHIVPPRGICPEPAYLLIRAIQSDRRKSRP